MQGEVSKKVRVLQDRVDGLKEHLIERINYLGGLKADSVKAQLVEMRDYLDKLKEKSSSVAPDFH